MLIYTSKPGINGIDERAKIHRELLRNSGGEAGSTTDSHLLTNRKGINRNQSTVFRLLSACYRLFLSVIETGKKAAKPYISRLPEIQRQKGVLFFACSQAISGVFKLINSIKRDSINGKCGIMTKSDPASLWC